MGQPGINRTVIVSFFVDTCLGGKPHYLVGTSRRPPSHLLMAIAVPPVYTGNVPRRRLPVTVIARPKRGARQRFQNILKKKPSNKNRNPPSPPTPHEICDKDSSPMIDVEKPQPAKILPWITALFQLGRPQQPRTEGSIDLIDKASLSLLRSRKG